jgi:hypothetical protein
MAGLTRHPSHIVTLISINLYSINYSFLRGKSEVLKLLNSSVV